MAHCQTSGDRPVLFFCKSKRLRIFEVGRDLFERDQAPRSQPEVFEQGLDLPGVRIDGEKRRSCEEAEADRVKAAGHVKFAAP